MTSGAPTCDRHNAAGKPCGNAPIPGGFVCRQRHGGNTPQVRAAAAKRLQYMEAEGEVGRLLREADVPAGIHPLDGLLDVVARSGAQVRLLGMLVGQLSVDPETTWTTVTTGRDAHREIRATKTAALTGYDHNGNEVPAIRVQMYNAALRLYHDACKTALAADIDERMIRNSTATSDAFLKAVNTAMVAAHLTAEQHENFRTAIAAELRRINTGLLG